MTRTFSPGDKFLVLLPIPGKPLHAKYHGPYEIIKQLGPVGYVVSTLGRCKTKRVCHINLLKPYHEREPRLDFQHTEIKPEVVGLVDCVNYKPQQKVSSLLTTLQKTELSVLLDEFGDNCFKSTGKTHLVSHYINLKTGTLPCRSTPYRFSPDKIKFVQTEIATLRE